MRLRLLLAVFLLVALGIVTACQLIAGIGDKELYDGAVANNPCSAADLPQHPSTWDDTTKITVTAALSKIMLGASDGGPYYGFNLDKTCTCEGQGESCLGSTVTHCDDEGGIDNYARHAFETINQYAILAGFDGGVITEDKFNSALASGESGAILEVSNYNGQPDDGKVTVTIYASLGYQGYPDASPLHTGSDKWLIDPGSISGKYSVSDAYVAGGVLVATGLNFPIVVGSTLTQPVTIQLDDGVIRAELQMNGTNLTGINGTLGGRWDPAKFLPSLQVVPDPLTKTGYLCGDASLTYGLLKKAICENTDITRAATSDGTGACNSVSMGLGFVAEPAIKGNEGGVPNLPLPCGAAWADDCSN
jgi:hypothetical protein